MLYFWKAQEPRTSKLIFPTVKYTNTQIKIHKYTNTAYDKVPFLNSWWFKDVKNDILKCPKCYEIWSEIRSHPRSKSLLVDFRLLHCPPRFIWYKFLFISYSKNFFYEYIRIFISIVFLIKIYSYIHSYCFVGRFIWEKQIQPVCQKVENWRCSNCSLTD